MKELISIIVPIYNAENQIRKCIDSILGQTYKNIELILVNDGSDDESPRICDEYAQQDLRVKVIHKENGGVSSARNKGITVSKGEYIGFVDSDDWLETDMYEYLLKSIKLNSADVACCGYYKEFEDKTEVKTREDMISSSINEILENFIDGKYEGSVWNKLFTRSVIKHEFDIKMAIGEDAYFLFQAIKNAKRITYNSKPKYHYSQRLGSATKAPFSLKLLDTLDSVDRIYDSIKIDFPDQEKKAKIMVFNKYLAILNLMLYYDVDIQYSIQFNSLTKNLLRTQKGLNFSNYSPKFRLFAFSFFRFNKDLYRIAIKAYYRNRVL